MNPSPNHQPPKIASRLFDWWAKNAQVDDLKGDLDEGFLINIEEKGLLRARIFYIQQVVSLCSSYALKRRKASAAYSPYYSTNSSAMFHNYFKIAIRNLLKQKLFTSINILGLALGMSICLLALSISTSIIRSDHFHEKKDRIFQVNTYLADADTKRTYAATFPEVAAFIAEKYPFVETALSVRKGFEPTVKHHGHLLDFHGYYVDPQFFQVFSFELLQGDPATALSAPNTMVITSSVAEKLFRDSDPMGKILETEDGNFTVTGVMPDLKETHFYFQVLTSTHTYAQYVGNQNSVAGWQDFNGHYLYLLLRPNTENETLRDALAQTSRKAEEYNLNRKVELQSIVLDKVVPRWDVSQALGIGWDYPSMLFFLFIGLLILLPAVFNYINLSIARAMKRAKEIGIRKVVGATKQQVKVQFMVETILLTFLALVGSTFIFGSIQKEFLSMVVAAEVLDTSMRPALIIIFVLFALIIGILAGIFPAVYFSRLNPIHTLKGDTKQGKVSVSGIKKGLFVFQFGLSLFFIIGVATMARQYQHVFSHDHGFEHEQVLTIAFNGQNKAVALQELAVHPDVSAITTASHLPGIPIGQSAQVTPNGKDTIPVVEVFVGEDFVQNLKMKLVCGQVPTVATSTKNEEWVLVNEQFLRSMAVFGQADDTLSFTLGEGIHARIAGVLKDIHYEPLSQEIRPMVLRYSVEKSHFVLISLQSANIQQTVAELETIWRGIDQKIPFEASFLDDEIERAYRFLTVQIKMFSFLGALAIIIACLGLLGMVSYTTENRTKEIAIRKIMGASLASIYLLLTRDFVKLIAFSALLAIPLSYVFYDQLFLHMLMKYGLGLGVLEVVFSVLFLFVLGFLLIYWQSSKVAQSNPATRLRYE